MGLAGELFEWILKGPEIGLFESILNVVVIELFVWIWRLEDDLFEKVFGRGQLEKILKEPVCALFAALAMVLACELFERFEMAE